MDRKIDIPGYDVNLNKNMDLPNMIVDAATSKYVEAQKQNTCTFEIKFHQKYEYKLSFVATKNDVIVTYKTLELRCPKADRKAMNDIAKLFAKEMENDMSTSLSEDIEYDGYWPDNDEYFDINTFRVFSKDTLVFHKRFKNISDVLLKMMDMMSFLN